MMCAQNVHIVYLANCTHTSEEVGSQQLVVKVVAMS